MSRPRPSAFSSSILILAISVGVGSLSTSEAQDLTIASNDDSRAWLSLPQVAASDLSDVTLRLERQRPSEIETTLRAYRVAAYQTSTGKEIPNLHFSHAASLHFGMQGLLYVAPSGNAAAMASTEHSLSHLLTPYWQTGAGFIQLGGIQQDMSGVSLPIQNTGEYELRAVAQSSALRLVSGSPYPRLITPNGGNNHRVFFFFENPSGRVVSGTLYNRHGAKVRDISIDANSPNPNALVWDGRDETGSVVPGGAYFYKISDGRDSLTGSVGVAR